MVQGGLKKVQGGLEPPLAPHFPRLCYGMHAVEEESKNTRVGIIASLHPITIIYC